MVSRGIDILGNIAIVKFSRGEKVSMKKKFGEKLLREMKSVRSVYEKVGKFSGRLRVMKVKYLAGEKNKEVLYRENGCLFRFNVESCYFSPRLGSERLRVAKMVRRGENVLVMFGGVAPYAVVIAEHSKARKVVSVEIGRECSKYARENVKLNKLNNVEIVQGDVRKKVKLLRGRFDRIVMARPNLKDSFLDVGFGKIKKGGIIHYYGFYDVEKVSELRKLIEKESKKAKKKVKILKIVKAGEIGVRKFRYRVDIKVL